jgi:hypothetical protein
MKNTKYEEQRKKRLYWTNVITAWYFSGLASRKFCGKHGIKIKDFRRWLYKLKIARPVIEKEEVNKKPNLEYVEPIKFIPVRIADIQKDLKIRGGEMDIILPNKIRIRLGKNFDEEFLIRTISTLMGEIC